MGSIRSLYNRYKSIRAKRRYKQRLKRVPELSLRNNQNVLIVVVDCLRADHTSIDRRGKKTTPHIKQLGQGTADCITAAPWTFPSVPAILTGLYPHKHGARFDERFHDWQGQAVEAGTPNSLRDDVWTIGEYLDVAGYETAMFTAVTTASIPVSDRFGYIMEDYHKPADEMVDSVLDWWDKCEGDSRFAHLQFGDLHGLNLRSDDVIKRIPNDHPFQKLSTIPESVDWAIDEEREEHIDDLINLYEASLWFIDRQMERLTEELSNRQVLKNTIIVITGDHGEAFGEHIEFERRHFNYPGEQPTGMFHGKNLFQETIRVPLVMHGIDWNTDANSWVSTVDIVPTIMNELGAETPQSLDGKPLQKKKDNDQRYALSEQVSFGYEQKTILSKPYKLIVSPDNDISILFDLTADSGEKYPIPPSEKPKVHKKLRSFMPKQEIESGSRVELDADTERALRDLGYI